VQPPRVRGQGRAVQVDPIKPTLKAPGIKLLNLKYDKPLSNIAFKFSLRRYNKAIAYANRREACEFVLGRSLHSFPFQLNLSSSIRRITQINS
jgi:hypothetical protein